MRLGKLIPNKRIRFQQNLLASTIRGFSGGWNVLDEPMNLSHIFATTMDNCFPDNGGNIRTRQGTERFAQTASYFSTTASLVNMYYFNESLVGVGSNGEIIRVNGEGHVTRIWDTTIAAALPGAPSAWSATDFVSFEIFNGHLIICNGIDKPLDIDSDFVVEYLQDAATNTNINVPICKYVVAVGRYLLMAGDPLEPDRVHISAKDAAGTWYGDPPPNDATRLDVGSVLPSASVIRGIFEFRGRAVVVFAEGIIFGIIGEQDDNGNHVPNFDDSIAGYGSISHRSVIAQGDDALFMDLEGVPSIKRTALSTSFKPERISELVDPRIKEMLSTLSFEALENRVFSVYDKTEGQFLLFVPNAELQDDTTETVAFVYTYRPALRQSSWARFRGWNFTCGARSLAGTVFFGDANGDIWRYGSRQSPINQDYTVAGVGVGIEFDWELPWLDFDNRGKTKQLKYVSFDTTGASEFAFSIYVDNFTATPARTINFSGGDQGNFGNGPQPFGGGRNTSRKKLISCPVKFEIAKLRFSGTANAQLAFVSVTMHTLTGGINR